MFMMMKLHNNKFIKIQRDCQYVQHCKVIMPRYLLMDKLAQEKPILCKDLNIILQINVEE